MKTRKKIAASLLALLMIFSYQCAWAETDEFHFQTLYYKTVLDGLLQNYRFEADTAAIAKAVAEVALRKNPELLEELINVTADQFDAHTDYYTPEEVKAFTQSLNAEYVGIGISVIKVQGAVEVESVFVDGPAAAAGIKAGDRFLKINGQDVTNCAVDDLVPLVRGEAGSVVELLMERDGKALEFKVQRAAVRQNSVSYQKLEKGLGYLYISVFNNSTAGEVKEADAFFRANGIKKLVIDLRDNPGGDLLSVVNTLGFFVPQGKTVVRVEYNDQNRNYSLRSVGDVKKHSGYKLAVLVNGGSASAAELFAGNIRDYKLGKLIGSSTFGKGTVQEFVGLLNTEDLKMGQIKLTTAEYVLPGGEKIHGVGLKPDYWQANRTISLNTDDMEPMEFGYAFREGDSGKGILALKQRFDALGYYVGEVNEQFDRELTISVKQFQEKCNLPVTGIMDMDTETLFASVVSEAQVLVDDQLARGIEYLKTGR